MLQYVLKVYGFLDILTLEMYFKLLEECLHSIRKLHNVLLLMLMINILLQEVLMVIFMYGVLFISVSKL
jgi:hypothetical protein